MRAKRSKSRTARSRTIEDKRFNEWSKEKVKSRTARSITREEKKYDQRRKEKMKTRTTRSRTREDKVPGTQFCRSGFGILRKGEVIP
ncbi:Pre-mRNA-splicing factor [Trichinella spiralis]|uniref:Pre-mRNA-splicing factor n=1 Tax=Trichinella spiralis TaxID=6334 RepID=A0ABR3K7L4_TRISP